MKSLRALLAFSTLALAACSTTGQNGGGGSGSGSDSDSVRGTALGSELPERTEGASFLGSNVDRARFSPVHFAFDSTAIGAGERAKLQAVAEFCRSNRNSIILAGFTDERGTPEYNRGLGERRALTVREELMRLGVSGGRLQTVSFGAELPADAGSNESAWAKNRRAEFGVVK
jgi:peptidoglycan-associated lipoprotein